MWILDLVTSNALSGFIRILQFIAVTIKMVRTSPSTVTKQRSKLPWTQLSARSIPENGG